jgi:hypothetical protein
MAVLPGVLGYRTLRRTVQVRLETNTLRLPGTRRKRLRCAWHTLLHVLATKIRETSGLALVCNQLPVSCLCSLTYLRERLEAFKGLSFTTFSVPDLIWVARLQEPFFHLIWGSGQDWQ